MPSTNPHSPYQRLEKRRLKRKRRRHQQHGHRQLHRHRQTDQMHLRLHPPSTASETSASNSNATTAPPAAARSRKSWRKTGSWLPPKPVHAESTPAGIAACCPPMRDQHPVRARNEEQQPGRDLRQRQQTQWNPRRWWDRSSMRIRTRPADSPSAPPSETLPSRSPAPVRSQAHGRLAADPRRDQPMLDARVRHRNAALSTFRKQDQRAGQRKHNLRGLRRARNAASGSNANTPETRASVNRNPNRVA